MIRTYRNALLLSVGLLLSKPNIVWAQLAEVKPYDTTKNNNAAANRLFADAVKERVLGNTKEAEGLFLRFVEAKPSVAAAYYELARINTQDDHMNQALQYIRKAVSLDPTNKWYQEMEGNILANEDKYAEAAQIFTKLADNYAPNDDYLRKSSLLYQESKQYDKAISEIEKLIEKRGLDEELLMEINQVYLKQNKVKEAAATLQRLIDANPKEGRYYALLAEMYHKQKDELKAKETFDLAEKKFPDDIAIELGLASYYKRASNIAKYTEYVNKSIRNASIDEQTQITLLVSYLQDAQNDSAARMNALALAAYLVEENNGSAPLLGLYGDLLSVNNQAAQAVTAYKQSLAIDPASLNVWQQLLFNLTDKKDADSLIALSDQALGLYPSAAILYYLNGLGYVNKGLLEDGIKSFTTAIEFQPEENKALLAEMYSSLGDAYNASKKFQLADKSFDQALKLNPVNATVLNNYAYYLSVRNVRLEDAAKFSSKSLEIRPGEPTFLDTYGWIFYQQGNYDKAKVLIQEAIEKSADLADATLYDHLGDVYFRLNNLDKAIENWTKAKDKDPDNEQINLKIKNRKINE